MNDEQRMDVHLPAPHQLQLTIAYCSAISFVLDVVAQNEYVQEVHFRNSELWIML